MFFFNPKKCANAMSTLSRKAKSSKKRTKEQLRVHICVILFQVPTLKAAALLRNFSKVCITFLVINPNKSKSHKGQI